MTTKKIKNVLTVFILLSLAVQINFVFANSAEPPALIIIVNEHNDSLNITLNNEQTLYAKRLIRPFDMQFNIYYNDINKAKKNADHLSITVTNGDDDFTLKIPQGNAVYRNIYTLDVSKKTLTKGQNTFKSIVYIGARILLTLIIEAVILAIFKFREKLSWVLFLLINLITQSFLNITLSSTGIIGGYLLIALIFIEIFILIFEGIVFGFFAKEKTALRRIVYIIVANITSLIVGGMLLMMLPI